MLIFGHKFVKRSEIFEKINLIEDIENTKSNSVVVFDFDAKVANFCLDNNVPFATIVKNQREALFSNALKAKFIIADKTLAPSVQKTAENYMFDSRVLLISQSDEDIDFACENEVDGVLFVQSLKL
jgi:hypothetical protein